MSRSPRRRRRRPTPPEPILAADGSVAEPSAADYLDPRIWLLEEAQAFQGDHEGLLVWAYAHRPSLVVDEATGVRRAKRRADLDARLQRAGS